MKRIISLLVAVVMALGTSAYAADNEFNIGYYDVQMPVVHSFQSDHADVSMVSGPLNPNTTDELISSFLTNGFTFDAFPLFSSNFNLNTIIDKGYLADLSSNSDIVTAVSRMYPDIQKLVTRDGCIFGLPTALDYGNILTYDPVIWAEAGFSEADVPTSFPEFLDFLEDWVAWVRSGGNERHFVIYGFFDEALYNESSYTAFLTEKLLNSYIIECEYANESLTFDTPVMRELLARCETVGQLLYSIEKNPLTGPSLLQNEASPSLKHMICLRTTTEQPKLIEMNLSIMAVREGSKYQELGAQFALHILSDNDEKGLTPYLFQDATPVRNPDFDETVLYWENQVNSIQTQLSQADNLTAEAKAKLEDQLEAARATLTQVSSPEREFVVSEDDLATYRQYADSIYIKMPSIFALGTENGQMLLQLIDRYAAGLVTIDQFIQRLAEVAWMVEMEGN